MSRRVLVTGGYGFIGVHLTNYLAARNYEILAIDAMTPGTVPKILHRAASVDPAPVDILDEAAMDRVFDKFRPAQVYHLAAHHFVPYCEAHPRTTIRTNIEGTQAVADACAKYGVQSLLFASTAAVYAPASRPHRESEATGPVDIYGLTKVTGERIMEILARRAGVKVRTARLFNVIGPGETNPHLLPEIMAQLQNAADEPVRLGNLSSMRDYVDVSDVVSACFEIMNDDGAAYDVFNVGTGAEYSAVDIIRLLEHELRRDIAIRVDQARLRRTDRPHLCADISKIRDRLNWQPKLSLRDSIRSLNSEETRRI